MTLYTGVSVAHGCVFFFSFCNRFFLFPVSIARCYKDRLVMMIQYFLLTCLAWLYLRVHKSNTPGLSPALRDLLYIALRHYRPCSSLHGNKDAGKQKHYCLLHCVIIITFIGKLLCSTVRNKARGNSS